MYTDYIRSYPEIRNDDPLHLKISGWILRWKLYRKEVVLVLVYKTEQGQGLVEYALILVLVAVVVIAVITLFGPLVGNMFSNINSSIPL
jgi:pilus assembly protein Flp/PilA